MFLLHAKILPPKHFDTEQLPEEWKNIFLSQKCWKTRSFQDASQAWRLQSDAATASRSCRESQVHVCVFISHMLTVFCLSQNKLFQPQKTHPHGGNVCRCWADCVHTLQRQLLWSLGISEYLHLHTVKVKKQNKTKWIPMYPHLKIFTMLIPS